MKFLTFPRTTVLSALFSLASLGGSVGSCAYMNQDSDKPRYAVPADPVRFCYQELAEVTCYTTPQSGHGEIVAYDAQRIMPAGDDEPVIAPSSPAAAPVIPNSPPPVIVTAKPKPVVHTAKKPAAKKKAPVKKKPVVCPCPSETMAKPKTIAPLKEPVPAKEPTAPVPTAAPSPAGTTAPAIPLSNQAPAAP